MSFSFIFFGLEEALRGEISEDTLTIAIKYGDKTILLGECFTKDAIRDVIEATAFAAGSCRGIKELYLRSGRCDVLLFPSKYCHDNSIVLKFGTYEPLSHVRFKIVDDLLRLDIYREKRKYIETVEIPRGEFVSSVLGFLRSFLEAFPDEELMRELEIVEEMAGRKRLLPAEKRFKIKVEWLGEVKCGERKFPLVYAIVSYGREIFSGLIEPVALAGDLINLLKFSRGVKVQCEVDMTPYNDVAERATLLSGDKKVSDYLVLWFGSEWPGPVFVFKGDNKLVFVNVKTDSVIRVTKEEVETATVDAVRKIIRALQGWNGELPSPMRREDAVSMLTGELEKALGGGKGARKTEG